MTNETQPRIGTRISSEIRELSRQKVLLEHEVEKFRRITYQELADLDGDISNGVEITDLPIDIQNQIQNIRGLIEQVDNGYSSGQRDRAIYRALVRTCRVGRANGVNIDHNTTAGRAAMEAPNGKGYDQQKFDWLMAAFGIEFSTDVRRFNADDVEADDFVDDYPSDLLEEQVTTNNTPEPTPPVDNDVIDDAQDIADLAAMAEGDNMREAFPEADPMSDALFEQQLTDGVQAVRSALNESEMTNITEADKEKLITALERVLRADKENIQANNQFPAVHSVVSATLDQLDFAPQKKQELDLALQKLTLVNDVQDLRDELDQQETVDALGFSLATIMNELENPQLIVAELEKPVSGETESQKIARMERNKDIARVKLKEVIVTEFRNWVAHNTQFVDSLNEEKRHDALDKYMRKIGAKSVSSTQDWMNALHDQFGRTGSGFKPLTSSPILSMALRGKEDQIYKEFFASFTKKNATSTDIDASFSTETYVAQLEDAVDRMITSGDVAEKLITNYRRLEDDLEALDGDLEQYEEDLETLIRKLKTVPKVYKGTQWEANYKEYVQNHGKNAGNFNMWLETKSGIGMWQRMKYMFQGLWDMLDFTADELSEMERDGELLTDLKDKLNNIGEDSDHPINNEQFETRFQPDSLPDEPGQRQRFIRLLTALEGDATFKELVGQDADGNANYSNIQLKDKNGNPFVKEKFGEWEIADLRFMTNTLREGNGKYMTPNTDYNTPGDPIVYHVLTTNMPAYLAQQILVKKENISINEDGGKKYVQWHNPDGSIDPKVELSEEAIHDLNNPHAKTFFDKLEAPIFQDPIPGTGDTGHANASTSDGVDHTVDNLQKTTNNGEDYLLPTTKITTNNVSDLSQNDRQALAQHLAYSREGTDEVNLHLQPEQGSAEALWDKAPAVGTTGLGINIVSEVAPRVFPKAGPAISSWKIGKVPVGKGLAYTGSGLKQLTTPAPNFMRNLSQIQANKGILNKAKGFGTLTLRSAARGAVWLAAATATVEVLDSFVGSSPLKVSFGTQERNAIMIMDNLTLHEMVQRIANSEDPEKDLTTEEKEFLTLMCDENVQYFFQQLKKPGVAEQIGDTWTQSGRISLELLRAIRDLKNSSGLPQKITLEENIGHEVDKNKDIDPNMVTGLFAGTAGDMKVNMHIGNSKWMDFDTFDELVKIIRNPSEYY